MTHIRRPILGVVPAFESRDHNHKCGLLNDAGTTSPVLNTRRGVWVPAFAGTTAVDVARASVLPFSRKGRKSRLLFRRTALFDILNCGPSPPSSWRNDPLPKMRVIARRWGRDPVHDQMRWLWVRLSPGRRPTLLPVTPLTTASSGCASAAARRPPDGPSRTGGRGLRFVAPGEFGELGRGACDQDQGIVGAAFPSRLVARRSPPAGRLALPAAPCAAQKA